MPTFTLRALRRVRFFFVVSSLLFAFACSDDEAQVDRCADVTCLAGVCDPATGTCGNPESCETADDCLSGHACELNECYPIYPCDDATPCERGICVDGACTNSDFCTEKNFCLPNHDCIEGVCEYAPCADVVCDRGICEVSSGECVNAEVCTIGTERQDCLDDNYCYGQSCTPGELVCAEIECERGVCDPAIQGCGNAQTCESDNECVSGFFCNEAGSCRPNVCDEEFIVCARGVCEISTGECINAAACNATTECTDGFSCIDNACVPAGTECGEDGCEGNRVCTIDDEALTASCEENPNGCWRAIDCSTGRVCIEGVCQSPPPCEADDFEPNESLAEATDFNALSTGNSLEANICRGDIDTYVYDVDQDADFQGTLVVDLQYAREDEGLGGLTLELVDPDGQLIDTAEGTDGRLRIEHRIGVLNRGVYEIRVKDLSASNAGIRYGLYADVLPGRLADACLNPNALPEGQSQSGNTLSGDSNQLGSTCTATDNTALEEIWHFELADPAYVTLRVTPDSGANLTMDLRERCESVTSELTCVADPNVGSALGFDGILAPGEYFVVVQGEEANAGGEYTISYVTAPITCGAADATCVDADTSRFCRPERTGFSTENCALGCDAETGRCVRLEGDICRTAIDANGGFSGTIDWATFTGDYEVASGGCVPNSSGTQNDGPDAVYAVTVPANHLLDVSLSRVSGDYISLYLTTDCEGLPNSCLAGANVGAFDDEELLWKNDSLHPVDLFVIADIEDDTSYGSSSITINTQEVVCTALSRSCVSANTLEVCNDRGTQLNQTQCTFGCVNDACAPPPNDTCGTAIDLLAEPGNTYTTNIQEYVGDENIGTTCTGRSTFGPDAAFTFSAPAGEVITVSVNATFDASLWVATDCADTTGTCIAGADTSGAGLEQVQFVAEDGVTYKLFVDASSSSVNGSFTISANSQVPSCTPGEAFACDSSTTLSYCSPLGVPASYACTSTCTGSTCDAPSGQACFDPIVLANGDVASGDFIGQNQYNPAGQAGDCFFSAADEPIGTDTIHAVDLVAGQVLFARWSSTTSFGLLYLLSDCDDTNSCVTNTNSAGSGELVYQAPQDGRYYLIMDRSLSGSTSSFTYNIDIEILTPDCQPGFSPPFCRTDGTTLAYCDEFGFTQDYACDGACSAGICQNPTGDVCVDAIEITSGATVGGTFESASNAVQPSSGKTGLCYFDDSTSYLADGEDTIYKIYLFQGEAMQARLDSNYGGAYLYLMDQCDPESCLANNPRPSADVELAHLAERTGYHYIVVDSTSSFGSTEPYTLSVDVISGAVCAPNQVTCQGGTSYLCDSFGTGFDGIYPCGTVCADGGCAPEPTRDTCGGGTIVNTGTWVYDNFGNYTDTSNLSSSGCTGIATPGPDSYYTIDVPAGQILHASVDSLGFESPAVYIVRDCLDPGASCVAGEDSDANGRAEVFWMAELNERVHVVVDSTSSTADEPYRVWIETIAPECVPGQSACDFDGQTLLTCNSIGLFEEWTCSTSCSNDACDSPTGELCYEAIPLGDGESYSGDWDDFDNDVQPELGSCFHYSSSLPDGPEAVFSVDLAAGERLTATLTTNSTAGVLYVLDGCSRDTSGDCALARPDEKTLQYVAPVSGTYYVVADSDNSSEGNNFRVDIAVDAGFLCTPNSSICEDGTVEVCSEDGLIVRGTTSCPAGCANNTTCAQPAPVNDTCTDAEIIGGSISILGRYDDYTSQLDPGSACTGTSNPGPDAIYQVAIPANHVLEASVHAFNIYDEPSVYILSDCTDPSASCLAGDFTGDQTAKTGFASAAGEVVYVVADSDSSFDYEAFELRIELRPVECSTGQTVCDGSNLKTCNDLGVYDTESCYWGCSAGACLPTPNDTCQGAIDVSAGGSFTAPIEEYTSVYDPQPSTGVASDSCTGDNAVGPEMLYSLNAQAGDYVRLTLKTELNGALWVSTSCLDSDDAASSCLLGADRYTLGLDEYLEFTVPTTGTYFIFADIDSSSTTLSGPVTLEVDRQPAGTCTANARTCLDANTVQYCDDAGTAYAQQTCVGGCTNGACGTPSADVCADALDVSTTGTYVITMDDLVDNYTLSTDACLGELPGNDAVFFADVAANEVLHVEVSGATGSDPAVYMTSDCSRLDDQLFNVTCIEGSDGGGENEVITYSPTQAERVWVVLDSSSNALDNGDWTLDVYNGPPTCSDTVPCTAGEVCVSGYCRVPTGDNCPNAIPLLSGDSDTKTFAGTNELDLGDGAVDSCLFSGSEAQRGTDHVYFVDLLAGQQLAANFTSTSSYGIMYLTSDCGAPGVCLDNTSDGTSGSLTYTATQDERIFIVMDRTLSGSADGYEYTLNVTIQ